jgi:hypothetical protein
MLRSPIRETITINNPGWFSGSLFAIATICWMVLNIVFLIYCVISICYALQGYGHSYCKSSSIPLYTVVCFFLTFCWRAEQEEANIFTWTMNYNHGSYTEKHVTKLNLLLPFYQSLINGLLFAWGYIEYYNVQCQEKLSHLLIYKIGEVFMIVACILMIINFICIFIYRDNVFTVKTVTQVSNSQV